jgi:hypothetical protein
MAWSSFLPSWLRPKSAQERRLDDTYRTIDAALPADARREPAMPTAPRPAPSPLAQDTPVMGRGTYLVIPLAGPAGMTLEQRQMMAESALRGREVSEVLRAHGLRAEAVGLAARPVHDRAAALGLPPGEAPWMLTIILKNEGNGNPSYNTYPRFRQAVSDLYEAAANGLQRATGRPVRYDHRLFEMLNNKDPAPMRLDEQQKADAALRATLTLVRTLEGTGRPIPVNAAVLANQIAIYYGDATIDPSSGRATPPKEKAVALASDARRDLLDRACLVVRDARALGVTDPQMDAAIAALETAGKDMQSLQRRAAAAVR